VRDGERAFRQMSFVSIQELQSAGAVEEVLRRAQLISDPGVRPQYLDTLIQEAAEFIRLRFVAKDAAAYQEWRLSRGCRFLPIERLEQQEQVLTMYPAVFGRPAPSSPSTESVFAEYWAKTQTMYGGANSLNAIASERPGLVLRVGYSKDREHPQLSFDPEPGDRLWYGPISSSMRRWFDLPSSPETIVKRDGKVLLGMVGLISQWADGSRRPLILAFLFDQARSQWVLWLLSETNYDPKETPVASLEY